MAESRHDTPAPIGAAAPSRTVRIVGGGPVSLALRGLLAREGFRDDELACDEPARELPPALAARVLALSTGSWQLLGRIAALPESAPIRTVDVSLRGSAGRTRLQAGELGVPALGHVVRYEALHRALAGAVARVPRAAAAEPPAAGAHALTVIADGNPGEDSRLRDFDQAALLATVRVQRPAEGVAFERFTTDGPLALLPLPQRGHCSLVWCMRPALARQRARLPAPALARELRHCFGPWLGALEVLDRPHVAPLQRRFRTQIVRGSEVTIGNAAQALHPVAGQGLNLGLRDAFVLATRLGEARARGAPLVSVLAGFASARQRDRLATIAATDTLADVFTLPFLAPLQSLAIGLLDVVPPARRALARAFMYGLRR